MCETVENRFNLVEEPWIPVADAGLVSLRDIFTKPALRALGGNPLQKIAMTKLLLAIVHAAWTPDNDNEWDRVGYTGMAKRTTQYLEEKKELFWLFGEKPFLQMPNIIKTVQQGYGAVLPYIATGNTTVLLQTQVEQKLSDVEKAQLVLLLMGFAAGGKKTDNTIVLSHGYRGKTNDKGKPATGKPGPALGFLGYLHSFITGRNICETLWLNIITKTDITTVATFEYGIGHAPWEAMPEGEDCEKARMLRASYYGRLVPLSRFILLRDDYIHYSEGVAHPSHKDGGFDLSITVDFGSSSPKALWVDPEKRPWRQLPALLSFLTVGSKKTFECLQLRMCMLRTRTHTKMFGIWSGGLKVSCNAGEQFVSGMDDFVESEVAFSSDYIGDEWFSLLKNELKTLDEFSSILLSSVNKYYKRLTTDGSNIAKNATSLYWQLCERNFQDLIDSCNDLTGVTSKARRKVFADYVNKVYNTYCPADTARQLDAWAANRPNLKKYFIKN